MYPWLKRILGGITATFTLAAILWFCWGLFGPEDRGYWDFCGSVKVIEYDFQKFYVGKKDYPAYTMDQLKKMGAIGKVTQGFIDDYHVYFTPFTPNTPDDQVVLRIGYSPLSRIPWFCEFAITKYEITHDLVAEAMQRSDHMEFRK